MLFRTTGYVVVSLAAMADQQAVLSTYAMCDILPAGCAGYLVNMCVTRERYEIVWSCCQTTNRSISKIILVLYKKFWGQEISEPFGTDAHDCLVLWHTSYDMIPKM